MEQQEEKKYSVEIVEPKLFSGAVADEIVATLNEAISEHGRASLVLSGGKTPGAIYRLLAVPPRVSEVDWTKVSMYFGDERWVPKDDVQSNFKMVNETFLAPLGARAPKIFPVDTTASSPAAGAAAYGKIIKAQEPAGADGVPLFDLMLLGMGDDGHTASIFPGDKTAHVAGEVAFAPTNPHDNLPRISLTPQVIFGARRIVFIVKGDTKADMVKRVLEGSESAEALPAARFKDAASRVTWFIDSGAAKNLTQYK